MKKFRKGEKITSLDELVRHEFIYVKGKIYHEGFFKSWQLHFILNLLNSGEIYSAERIVHSLNPKIVKVAEKLGWTVNEQDDGTTEFAKMSPAGEDFRFYVNSENAVHEIYDYYDSFDIDEHVGLWMDAKRSGVGGVPSVRDLVKDAEEIFENLKVLAEATLSATKK